MPLKELRDGNDDKPTTCPQAIKKIVEDQCKVLYSKSTSSRNDTKEVWQSYNAQADQCEREGWHWIKPNINDIVEAKSRLLCGKAPGGFDSIVAEMLKALCPTVTYIIAWHFIKRMANTQAGNALA